MISVTSVKAYIRQVVIVGLSLTPFIALANDSNSPAPIQLSIKEQPSAGGSFERIVSAGGSITEIIHALGLIDRVIAVDSSSLYPLKAQSLPQVGYFRSLGAEGVLSLNPDLLVAARGAGPEKVLQQIANVGVEVKQFEQTIYTLDSWRDLVMEIGEFFNTVPAAKTLIKQTISNIQANRESRRYQPNSLNAVALLNSGQRGLTVAGKNTMPDFLFELAEVKNLASNVDGYKPFSQETLASQKIDLILVPHHTIEAMGGKEGVCANRSIAYATSEKCHVYTMDALLLLGLGARIDQAVKELIDQANELHHHDN